jgi:hypothetical protein
MRIAALACLSVLLAAGCASKPPVTTVTPAPRTDTPLPSGWHEIKTSGVALAFPADWTAVDLSPEALAQGSDQALGKDPKLAGMKDQVKALAAQGIFKVFVFDSTTVGKGFATNCNMTVTPLPSGATAEMAAEQAKTQIAALVDPSTPVEIKPVTLKSGQAVTMRTMLKTAMQATPRLLSRAYLVAKDGNLITVTFTCPPDQEARVAKVAEQTMDTFRFTQ